MKDDLAHAAAQVISKVELHGLRLRQGSFGTSIDRESDWAPAKAELAHEARLEKRADDRFLVFVNYNFEARSKQEESGEGVEPTAFVKAQYEINYGFPEPVETSDEDLLAFAKTNAIFNSWSYFREYLDNCLTRMALPPFYLPLFRLSGNVEAAGSQDGGGAGTEADDAG